MKTILLNGNRITDKSFHKYFKEKLDIIGYYGNNLDAMYDALSVYNEDLNIYVYDFNEDLISGYGRLIIKTLEELQEEKDNVSLRFIKIKRLD